MNNIPKRIRLRMGYLTLVLIVCTVGLIFRVAWFQIVRGADYAKQVTYQSEADRKLQSPRGTIIDRDGKVLAISEMAKSLYADPTILNESPHDVAALLAPYLQMEPPEIQQKLEEETAFVWLKRTLSHDAYTSVSQVIKDHKLQGLPFMDENHRWYPNGAFASQLIGYVGIDDQGLDGIEMMLDKEIRGGTQRLRLTTDKNNIPILNSVLEQILPDKERTARLTIDSTIQFFVEQELDTIVEAHHPSGASIIVMDPQTGEILAMGNRPTFDPNQYGKANAEQYKNRAVMNMYEPGSTFKPLIAAAAVDSGKWKVNQTYLDSGSITIGDRTIHNWDNQGRGNVTIRDILKFSINTGMAEIGLTTGAHTLTEYAKRFGFGKPTGIELPGESSGLMFREESMGRIDEAIMSIGQGIAVTPIQMVQAFSAIANKGAMMRPFVIKEIDNPDGSVYQKTEPEKISQPIQAGTAEVIMKYLEEEMNSGGGMNAHIPGYRFAGKTGTAQRLNAEGTGYAEGQYIASFMGFGPVENPQYIVLVVIDNPQGIYYGAQVAAPAFKRLMTNILQAKGIPPSQQIEGQKKHVAPPKAPKHALPPIQRNADGVLMPSFIGWDSREVNDWLQQAGLGFVPQGTGRAIYQRPEPGSYAPPGSNANVTFKR